MSGHSHWAGIKHQKGIADAKRSAGFSKLGREIMVAARQGKDPVFNSRLRIAIEKAKAFNMPTENIERAIKRGSGEIAGENLEEFIFEAFGPAGIAIIIEGITDNRNRTLGEIKQILNQNGGKLASEGSVKWLFERKGAIVVNPTEQAGSFTNKEELELVAIEAGAQDVYWHENLLDIYTRAEELEKVKKNLEEKGIKISSASLDWVAKEEIPLDEESKLACQKIFEILDENDSVQEIYSNIKLP